MSRYPYKDQNSSSNMYEIFGNGKSYACDPRWANRKLKSYSNQESTRANLNSPNQRYDTGYTSNSNNYSYRNRDNASFDADYTSPIKVYSPHDDDNPSRYNYGSSRKTDYTSRDSSYISYDYGNSFQSNNYSSRDSLDSSRNSYSVYKNDFSSSNTSRSPRKSSLQEAKFKGIRNICNTCFMNSTLQIFMNLPQFMSDIINSLDKINMRLDSSFVKEICRIFYEYVSSQKDFLQVNTFYNILREKIPYLGDGSQHDVAEFFQLFAESCESELLPYISSESRNKHTGEILLSKTQMLLYDPFMKNFGFSIITSVVCGDCGNAISEEVQTNFILNIPLASQTLEGCIAKSFDREPIQTSSSKDSDHNSYSYRRYEYDYRHRRTIDRESKSDGYCCKKCRNKSSFYLSTSFYRIPRFLFIQIARFDASLTKNSSPINVPDRIDLIQYINDKYFAGPEPIRVRNQNDIDINQLYSLETDDSDLYSYSKRGRSGQENQNCQSVSEDEQMKQRSSYPNASYHLVSVILHEGTFSGGHYTAAIKSQGSRESWTVISDDIVLENSSFNRSAPYCFIYQID